MVNDSLDFEAGSFVYCPAVDDQGIVMIRLRTDSSFIS